MADILGWLMAALISATTGALILWLPRELWRRWRSRLADYVDLALGRRVSRFRRRYRDRLLHDLRFIDLKGLGTVGSHHPKLEDVYVDVSLDHRAPHEVPSSLLSDLPGDIAGRYWLGDLIDKEEPRMLAVLGSPGSGKTTLLRYTVRQLLQENRRKRTVPILLYLRDHIARIVADPTVPLSTVVGQQLKVLGLSEPTGWFEQHLNSGDCLVLLDGLDEVARQEERRIVADWVEQQTVHYHKNDFVLTSRPHGYRSTPVSGATVVQVRGFTTKQVIQFVHNWYRMVDRAGSNDSTDDSDDRAKLAADDLLDRINNAPQLLDLTVNPLLLTMVANVHRYRGALPGSRVELYGEICQVMLWRRDEAKHLPIALNGEQKERMLRALALRMMCRQLRDMPRDQVVLELQAALRRISTRMSAEDLLADVTSSGLLIEREAEQYSFAHLTFQEYLAATQIRDTGEIHLLANSVDDSWWRETAILYAARSTGDRIVEACLSSGSVVALALAFDIAEEGDLDPKLRASLEEVLYSVTDDPEVRRLRNGVILTRYLRHGVVRTSAGGRVYASPVSRDIYQLFVVDTGGEQDVGNESTDPVTGIWASDADAFVRWVNNTTDSEPGYRLAASDELADPVFADVHNDGQVRHVWTARKEFARPDLWVPDGEEHPHLVNGDMLIRHVRQDMRYLAVTMAYLALHLADGPWQNDDPYWRHRLRAISFARSTVLDIRQGRSSAKYESRHAVERSEWEKYPFNDLLAETDLETIVDRVSRHYDLNEAILEYMFGAYAVSAISQRHSFRAALITDFVGFALLPYLRRLLEEDLHRERGVGWFIDRFVTDSGISDLRHVVLLDELVDVSTAAKGKLRLVTQDAPPSGHVRFAAELLADVVVPIFSRQQKPSNDRLSSIRIAALALAIEADALGAEEAGLGYRKLAAAATLLQRRLSGEATSDEMIMLAIV